MIVFNLNHIDKTKTKEEIAEIKELYKYYHYRNWCYQQAYKYFKKLNLAINMTSTGLIALGTVADSFDIEPGHFRKYIRRWSSLKDIFRD